MFVQYEMSRLSPFIFFLSDITFRISFRTSEKLFGYVMMLRISLHSCLLFEANFQVLYESHKYRQNLQGFSVNFLWQAAKYIMYTQTDRKIIFNKKYEKVTFLAIIRHL